jgi:hypothetical protein
MSSLFPIIIHKNLLDKTLTTVSIIMRLKVNLKIIEINCVDLPTIEHDEHKRWSQHFYNSNEVSTLLENKT